MAYTCIYNSHNCYYISKETKELLLYCFLHGFTHCIIPSPVPSENGNSLGHNLDLILYVTIEDELYASSGLS